MISPTDLIFTNDSRQGWEIISRSRCFRTLDIESLRLYAGVHSKRFGYHRLLSERFPYAVYYDQEGTTARVWAVLDCRSDPNAIREKLAGLGH
jgi:hypothetical protein